MFWERNGWVVVVYTKLEFGDGDLFAVDWPRLGGLVNAFGELLVGRSYSTSSPGILYRG